MHDYNETKRDPVHKEIKRRFHYLHEKLSHIKRLVLEYDTQNCGGGMTSSSNANGSNEIKEMDSLHYWHKLKRPPLIFNLFSIVGTLLSSLSQNLHFLGMFQGWSKRSIWFLVLSSKKKSSTVWAGVATNKNLHAVVKIAKVEDFSSIIDLCARLWWSLRLALLCDRERSSWCACVLLRPMVTTSIKGLFNDNRYVLGEKRKWKKKGMK